MFEMNYMDELTDVGINFFTWEKCNNGCFLYPFLVTRPKFWMAEIIHYLT